MTAESRNQTLSGRGDYAYSTLGSATAGQAVAAAAHLSYPDLMRTRLFEPLGMSDTAIQVGPALVTGGRSVSGLPAQPWVMDAYAPGAALVTVIPGHRGPTRCSLPAAPGMRVRCRPTWPTWPTWLRNAGLL